MSLHINLPADLTLSEFELKMILASQLFDRGAITSGQGAEMAGVNRRTFIELLGKYGVSAFQTPEDELLSEVANA